MSKKLRILALLAGIGTLAGAVTATYYPTAIAVSTPAAPQQLLSLASTASDYVSKAINPVVAPLTVITTNPTDPLLTNPEIIEELASHGIKLTLKSPDTPGSSADAIWRTNTETAPPASTVAPPVLICFSPLAVASWEPIQRLFTWEQFIPHQVFSLATELRFEPLAEIIHARKTWNQLDQRQRYYSNAQPIQLAVSTQQSSRLNVIYLHMLELAQRNAQAALSPKDSAAQVETVHTSTDPTSYAERIQNLLPLIPKSYSDPFEDYLNIGVGKVPLVLITESQYLAAKYTHKLPASADPVLLYPSPTFVLKYSLQPQTPAGAKLATLLAENSALRKIMEKRLGYRVPSLHNQSATDRPKLGPLVPDLTPEQMAALNSAIAMRK